MILTHWAISVWQPNSEEYQFLYTSNAREISAHLVIKIDWLGRTKPISWLGRTKQFSRPHTLFDLLSLYCTFKTNVMYIWPNSISICTQEIHLISMFCAPTYLNSQMDGVRQGCLLLHTGLNDTQVWSWGDMSSHMEMCSKRKCVALMVSRPADSWPKAINFPSTYPFSPRIVLPPL